MNVAEERKPARQRILDTASEMFYRDGVRAVGIDAIIARSGVAKMSLYRNFPSKDALVTAWLEDRNEFFWRRWDRAEASAGGDPRAGSKRSSTWSRRPHRTRNGAVARFSTPAPNSPSPSTPRAA